MTLNRRISELNGHLCEFHYLEYPKELRVIILKKLIMDDLCWVVARPTVITWTLKVLENELFTCDSPSSPYLKAPSLAQTDPKTVSNGWPIWRSKPKMGRGWYCISLQQNTYMWDPFWVTAETQPKYEYPLSWRLICRKGYLLGPVAGEDKKWVLNPLPIALPKHEMGLIF